ncbi:MAG: GAF domain-containing protein [Oscillospiraceae bacterium]|nr:GAF domain-containing protein [Oscillospiraceae bacterium]
MTNYEILAASVRALTDGENDLIANLSNVSAAIFESLEDVNWAGFYALRRDTLRGDTLVLHPFQGKPACIRIPVGKGVCGTAVALDKAQLVPDVHDFPGHIACDSASNSEIVIPLHANGEIVGVLDIDSPTVGRFTEEDLNGLMLSAEAIELAWERSLNKN